MQLPTQIATSIAMGFVIQIPPGEYLQVSINQGLFFIGHAFRVYPLAQLSSRRVAFPSSATEGTLLINIGNSVNGVSAGQIDIVNGDEVTGWAETTIGSDSRAYLPTKD